jgi:FAD/FMN-containing dehydrogenase
VIDLAGMKNIKADRARMLVSAEGGVLVGELYKAVVPLGVAVVSGGCPTVGVGGFTLGGGQSAISSKYGLACNNLTSMVVVTADGRLLLASEYRHPDLFWALRGGSGNFGIVTRFDYRLVPVTRMLAGTLTYPMAKRRDVLRFLRDFTASAPDELTTYTVFGTPFPDDVFGLEVGYCGDLNEGEKVLKPLRSFGHPVSDSIKAVPFLEAATDAEPAALPNCCRDGFFSPLSDAAIDAFCHHLEGPHPIYQTGIFDMHGAACRGDYAFPLRRPALDFWTWGFWRSDSERDRVGA